MKCKVSRASPQTSDVFSVSGDLTHREDVIKMATFMNDQLSALGVETRLEDLGTASFDGQDTPLPPAVLGKIGEDPNKKTLLIYGHFDVQPVSISVAGTIPNE